MECCRFLRIAFRNLNCKANPILSGQNWNDETWAVCKPEMLIKSSDAAIRSPKIPSMIRNTISQSAQINGTRDQGICNSDPESELSLIGGPKVRDDGQAVFKAQFPDPGEQAEALLEICQGDLGEARGIAATNLKFATCQGDKLYWWSVGVLISRQEPSVVMERLANSKLKRRTEIEVQLFKE